MKRWQAFTANLRRPRAAAWLVVGLAALVTLTLGGLVGALWLSGTPESNGRPAQAAAGATPLPTASAAPPTAAPPTVEASPAPTALPVTPAAMAEPATGSGAVASLDRAYPSTWERSVLYSDLATNYPRFYRRPRFTLYYQPDTYTAVHLDETLALAEESLDRVEAALGVTMPERFELLVAGTLYARPNAHLRGLSASNVQQVFILHDGTGTDADNAYFFTHELTHLVAANAVGSHGDSVMLSEGLATWVGYPALEAGGYLPHDELCAALDAAGLIPSMAAIEEDAEAFKGHLRHPFNYFAAGCFTGYLIKAYGLEPFRQLYVTSAYTRVYGKGLAALEAEWRATLAARQAAGLGVDPERLKTTAADVAEAYAFVFYHYDDEQPMFYEAYLAADRARVALWLGDFDAAERGVQQVHGILGWGR